MIEHEIEIVNAYSVERNISTFGHKAWGLTYGLVVLPEKGILSYEKYKPIFVFGKSKNWDAFTPNF